MPVWAAPLIAFSLFLLSRPYRGIIQDAHIYMGRALADLDPAGVGRDLMFVHDGQFGFSLFRFAAAAMVWVFGLALAAKILAVAAAFAWFLAAAALTRQFASGPAVWAGIIFAVLLPNAYGAPYPFGFAELIAIPRPFAEALVLAAMAALAQGRDALALIGLGVAALLHPIMALAGGSVFAAIRGAENRRLLLVLALGLPLLLICAWLGLPMADRLFTAIDPALRDLLEHRSPFLFIGLWPRESFPPLLIQAATLVIAASFQKGRCKSILIAILAAGLGGIILSAVFGDWLSSLLVLQAQPWRMAWLMAVAGAITFGICAVELWRRGETERLVLALLVLGWSFHTQLLVAGPAAVLALVFHFRPSRYAHFCTHRRLAAVWAFVIGVSAIWQARTLSFPWHFALASPPGYGMRELVLIKGYLVLPLCALAVYFAIAKPRIGAFLQCGAAFTLLAAAASFWDQRSPAQRLVEESRSLPDLTRLIERHPGEVLWIGGLAESWFILDRPQWASPLQGIPAIFSPGLAMEWRKRTQILMDLRLADQKSFAPWSEPESGDLAQLSREGVQRLCAQDSAPAWIIAPIGHGEEAPAGFGMKFWRLARPVFQLVKGDGEYVWRQIDAYGVIACAASERDPGL